MLLGQLERRYRDFVANIDKILQTKQKKQVKEDICLDSEMLNRIKNKILVEPQKGLKEEIEALVYERFGKEEMLNNRPEFVIKALSGAV